MYYLSLTITLSGPHLHNDWLPVLKQKQLSHIVHSSGCKRDRKAAPPRKPANLFDGVSPIYGIVLRMWQSDHFLCDYQNEDGKVYRVHNTPSCWPHWLTDSRRLNHEVVARPASSLAQDRESSPVETSILTTMLRRHGTPSYACSNRLT